MKKIGIMALVAVAVIAMFSSVASAGGDGPIGEFRVVEDFPSRMVAGSTYQARYTFRNLSQESVSVQVRFKVGHPSVGRGEWSVMINGTDVGETKAGVFWSNVRYVGAGGQVGFTVDVSPHPRVAPSEYTFTAELWSEGVRIHPPKKHPSEEPPTGGIRVTDALSSDQNWQVVFVVAIGVLGVATMICVKSLTGGSKKSKKRRLLDNPHGHTQKVVGWRDPIKIIKALICDIIVGSVWSVVVANAHEFGLPAWVITILFVLVGLAPWIWLYRA